MDKLLVKTLLRVVQVSWEGFQSNKTLRRFVDEFNIGWVKGASLVFDQAAKERIRELLEAEGVDPATKPHAWQGLTRAESLMLGRNEKWTDSPAKRNRVAIKTLPGQLLRIDERELCLPNGAHLDADWMVIVQDIRHESILVVENWECFNRIDKATIDFSRAGTNPLVVWRGDKLDASTDAAMAFLRALDRPTWAFVDFDPAGLLIAASLPNFSGVVAPDDERLSAMLREGLEDRYRLQLPASENSLNANNQRDIARLWKLIRESGRALPQEALLRQA
jgi:hypothetical protein